MVQHGIVHGSFREPLQNADATDVSIFQMMHVKRGPTWALQNSAISERAKPQFGISVFNEIADVVRVFETLWCISIQIAT